MLAPLDLTPVFSGRPVGGALLGYSGARPLVYGLLPPPEFLVGSVDGQRARDDREEEFSDLENPGRAVHWLAKARDAVGVVGGVTPEVADVLRSSFLKALECNLSPRERSQLWYCLRALGQEPPLEVRDKVLGVVVEMVSADGPLMVYASPDRLGAAVWEVGGVKSAPYEEGLVSDLVVTLCRRAADLIQTNGLFSLGELPPAPGPGRVVVAVVTPAGVWQVELADTDLEDRGLLDFYNLAASLVQALLGHGDSRVLDALEHPPMDLDAQDPDWVLGGLVPRLGAFLADTLFYAGLVLLALYLFWDLLVGDPIRGFYFLYCGLVLLPVLSAWMESSEFFGFRTLGKRMFGLEVRSIATSAGPVFLQALSRNLFKWYVSPLFLFCGYVWAFFHRHRRAWHDVVSLTIVLQTGGLEGDDGEDPPMPSGGASS